MSNCPGPLRGHYPPFSEGRQECLCPFVQVLSEGITDPSPSRSTQEPGMLACAVIPAFGKQRQEDCC